MKPLNNIIASASSNPMIRPGVDNVSSSWRPLFGGALVVAQFYLGCAWVQAKNCNSGDTELIGGAHGMGQKCVLIRGKPNQGTLAAEIFAQEKARSVAGPLNVTAFRLYGV
jgi:hypothetical protein